MPRAGKKSTAALLPSPESRLTIAFLTHYFSRDAMSLGLWSGITEQSRLENVNLICFPGNAPNSSVGFEYQANSIYNLVNRRTIDGLLIWGSAMLGSSDQANVEFLFNRFRDFPIINIGLALKGIPGILIDNYGGMYEACSHLIEAHGCRRLAFIRGPRMHQEAELRFTAYREALRCHDLPYDPRLVAGGNFLRPSGLSAVLDLCAAGRTPPDAVAAANDLMALGVLDGLRKLHFSVPDQVKVVGFDDLEEGHYLDVPLTTVRQPFTEMGKLAVKDILSLINGKSFSEIVTVPSQFIARQSCGCINPLITRTPVDPQTVAEAEKAAAASPRPVNLLTAVVRETEKLSGRADGYRPVIRRLVTAAGNDLAHSSASFIGTLNRELTTAGAKTDFSFFYTLLSALRRCLLPLARADASRLIRIENLIEQGLILVGDASHRAAARISFIKTSQSEVFQDFNQILVTTFNISEFLRLFAASLPRLLIRSCYLSLYHDRTSLDRSRLLLAYDDGRRLPVDESGITFPSADLAPPGFLPLHRQTVFIVHPLFFEKDQLGFIIVEEGKQPGTVTEILRSQLSAAVQGALLFQEREKLLGDLEQRADELQAATQVLARSNADLEQFAVITSHDLQEPLRKISLLSDRLRSSIGPTADDRARDYLQRIQTATLRMKSLINGLLSYSRLSGQAVHFTRLDLGLLIREAVNNLEHIMEREHGQVELGDFPSLEAEGELLTILFTNLIANALKFHRPGVSPRVRVTSRPVASDGREGCEISVEDNGIGIEEKHFRRIFVLFQRLHGTNEFEGTGIGLAICHRVIELHQGSIRVESAVGTGTRFIVTLPFFQDKNPAGHAASEE